jgi:murein DD-endopeptidase MepM/ murein hydrolase activator NlpD
MPNDKADAQTIQRKYDGKPQELAQHLVSICLNKTNVVKELFFILNNFSTLDVGYRFVNLIPTATLAKLTGTKSGKAFCELLLSWLKNTRPENNSNTVAPGVDSAIQLMKLKNAIDNAPPPQDEHRGNHCGVNPVTKQPGINAVASGIKGELRPGVGGGGHYHANRKSGTPHQGIDISGTVGDSVFATLGGKVTISTGGGYGNMVMIDHGNGYQSRYAHLVSFDVKGNQEVQGGDLVGKLGQTGNAKGQLASEAHVHFEVRKNNSIIDPSAFLNSACPVKFK